MVLARRLEKLEATACLHTRPKVDLSRLTDAQLTFLLDAQDPETGIGLSAAFASLSDEERVAFEDALAPVETCR
jgi:hypothetical protein